MAVGDYLDAKEVASELGISVSAVHGLRDRGTLPSEWMAGKRVWHRQVIKRYLADEVAQERRRSEGRVRLDRAS